MPQMVWSTLPDGYHDYYNARWYEFTGVPEGSTDGEGWNGMFHPDDQERAWARVAAVADHRRALRDRISPAPSRRHLSLGARPRAADPRRRRQDRRAGSAPAPTSTSRSWRCEEREVISQELSHRIKNIFSVISGLVALRGARAARIRARSPTDLRDRITALGRAHDFVRPHSPHRRPAAQPEQPARPARRTVRARISVATATRDHGRPATTSRSTTARRRRWRCCSTSSRPTRPNMARCRCPTAGSR